jgi:anti-anti-sigma factor
MNVKTDTKEKFIVLTPEVDVISANMTEDTANLAGYATTAIPHLIINMKNVREIDPQAAKKLADIQQESYERDCSFVICELQAGVAKVFDGLEITELMNITPTESEAWDIVQMEEIERELMGGFDDGG